MKLYSLPHSPFSARVRMQIYAKSLPVDIVPPPGFKTPEYQTINITGKVPALVLDDGTVLPESAVILNYLEQRFPQPPLLPEAPEQRAVVDLIGRFSDTYLQQPTFVLFGQSMHRTATDEELAGYIEDLKKPLQLLDQLLVKYGREKHQQLDLADCLFAPFMYFVDFIPGLFGETNILQDCDHVKAWWDWCREEPTGARVLEEIDLGLKAFIAKTNNQ